MTVSGFSAADSFASCWPDQNTWQEVIFAMARKNEAEQHLRNGLSPSSIASRMGISVGSVINYLQTRVGEGALRLSDIYFAFPADERAFMQSVLAERNENGFVDHRALQSKNLTQDELELFSVSSAESVGSFWFRKPSELVIEGCFDRFE